MGPKLTIIECAHHAKPDTKCQHVLSLQQSSQIDTTASLSVGKDTGLSEIK